MLNKWNKFKSYLTNSLGEVGGGTPGTFGGGGNPYLRVFLAIGKQIFKFLNKPSVQLSLFVAQGVMAHRAAMKAKRTGADILLQKYGTGAGMPVIYGTRRVGSTVVYMNTINNKELFVVYAIAGHEIDSFDLESIHLDGRTIKDLKIYRQGYDISDGSTRINFRPSGETRASGTFWGNDSTERANITGGANTGDNARMTFNCHVGTDSQAADPMLEGIISEWTSNHKLSGIAYIAANYEYDIQGMFTGIPNLTVVVNGKKVFDPRDTGQTFGTESTYTHSSNAALCLLDYITNDEYGKGLGSADLESDFASWKTAANDCDNSADTITHSSVVVERASTTTDRLTIANANEDDYNNFKVGNKFTISDGVTTYVSDKKLIDKDSSLIDIDGTNPVATLQLTFESGAVDTAITSNTTCTFTETQIRFDCNGVLDTDETVLENTKLLIANMRGIFTYSNGEYQIKVEGTESSVVSLDEDDILDSGITLSLENKEAKYNKVESEFYNAQKRYESDTTYYTGETSDSFLSDDGNEVLETRIQLPFCTNQRIAYNHAKAMLKRSRSQKSIAFVATPKVLKAKVGEVISITSSNLNLSSEQYRITNMVINPDLNISVNAVEYQTAVYGYVTPPDEEIGIIQDPVDGHRVEAPTGLTFTNKNSTTGEAAKLTWTDSTKYPSYEFRVQIVDTGNKTRYDRRVQDTTFYLDGISVANGYTAKVSAINALGYESDTTEIPVNVTTAPVTTPDIEQGSVGGFNFTATKMYYGTAGNFNNTDTAVYFDNAGQFSLKDKLSWNGTTLDISGNLTVENTISADKITLDGQDLSTLIGYGTSGGLSNQFKISNDATFENQFSVVQSTTNPASGGVRLIVGGVADSDGNNFKLEAPSEALDMGLQSSSGVEINVGATDTDGTGNLSLAKFNFAWSDTATQLTLTGRTRHDANVSVNRTAYNLYVDGDDTGYIQHNFNDYLAVKGASGSSVGLLQLYEASNNGTNYVALRSPTSVSANTTFVLPSADGTANQVLKTDGSGNLSFSSVSGLSAIASATNMADNRVLTASGSDSVNGEANLTFDGSTLAVTGSLEISADLTVNGTTVTLNTATLDVEDKNITLNYGAGDTSASANGAGITIQDAVNSTTDASLLWNTSLSAFKFSNTLHFDDGIQANFGTSSDLQILHDGTHSYIKDVGTGSLRIRGTDLLLESQGGETFLYAANNGAVTLYHDNSPKLATTSTGIDVTGTAVVDGLSNSGTTTFNDDVTFVGAGSDMTWDNSADKLNFDDNTKATFGNSDDLQIYHDGLASYIDDAGTGHLFIRANNLRLQKYTGETYLNANADGATGIYYDGAERIATTAGGVSVTGTVDATGTITVTGASSNIRVGTDTGKFLAGASNDLQIYHDGNDSYVDDAGTGILFLRGNGAVKIQKYTGEAMIDANADGSVYLYNDNAIKLQTKSDGVDITGELQADSLDIDGSSNFAFTNTNAGVQITHTDNVAAQNVSTLYIDHNLSGSDATTGADYTHRGIFVDVDSSATGGDTNDEHRVRGIEVDVRASGDSDIVAGIRTYTESQHSSGSISGLYGIDMQTLVDDTGTARTANAFGVSSTLQLQNTGSGGSTASYPLYGKLLYSTGSDKNQTGGGHGVYGEIEVDDAGQAQTISGLQKVFNAVFDNDGGSNVTVSGRTMLYAGDYQGTIPSDAYNIYLVSDAPSYIEGKLGLGRIPTQKLDVDGGIGINGTEIVTSARALTNIGTISSGALTVTADAGNEQITIKRSSNTNEQLILGFHSSDYATIQAVEQNVAFRPLVLQPSGANVGIGTTSPSELLHVYEGTSSDSAVLKLESTTNVSTDPVGEVQFFNTAAGNAEVAGYIKLNSDSGGRRYYNMEFGTGRNANADTKMIIDSLGNVLVGQTSALWNNSARGNVEINGSSSAILALNTGGARAGYIFQSGDDMSIVNTKNSFVRIFTNDTERFRIDNSGRVGIGTNSPDNKLTIGDSATIAVGKQWGLDFQDTVKGEPQAYIYAEGRYTANYNTDLTFGTIGTSGSATERLRIDSSGNLLFNTTGTTGSDLSDGGILLRKSTSTFMQIASGSTGETNLINFYKKSGTGIAGLHVIGTDKWGIGTESPSAKLHVDGDGSWIRHTGYSQILDMGNWTDGLVRIESTGAPMYIKAAGSNYMAFDTNSTERLRIDSSGNTIFKPTGSEVGRVTSSGFTTTGSYSATGNFNTSLGGYQVGGTTVITSARALTNIDSLTFTGTSGTTVSIPSHSGFEIDITGSTAGNIRANDDLYLLSQTGKLHLGANGTNSRLVVNENGLVGIGATSPSYKLDVNSGTTDEVARFQTTANARIKITSSNTANAILDFGDSDSSTIGQIDYDNLDNSMRFVTNAGERMRIDSSGRLGIGTVSPATKLEITDATSPVLKFLRTSVQAWRIGINGSDFRIDPQSDTLASPSLTINSAGNVGIATTGAVEKLQVQGNIRTSGAYKIGANVIAEQQSTTLYFGDRNDNDYTVHIQGFSDNSNIVLDDGFITMSGNTTITAASSDVLTVNRTGSDGTVVSIKNDGTEVGTINVSGSSTSYNTSSDYRLKENVTDMTGALSRVNQLQPKRFNFISDDTDTLIDGFLAHEVSDIVPEAISGTKDEVDDDGNPVYQGIDQSKLVPLLVKAIQEQQAQIEALQEQINNI